MNFTKDELFGRIQIRFLNETILNQTILTSQPYYRLLGLISSKNRKINNNNKKSHYQYICDLKNLVWKF